MPIADDLGLVLDAELPFGLDLGGQAMGVPAESALHPAPAHGLVPRHDVLDVAGQQVPVVRQAVGERRAVVEDELVGAVVPGRSLLDRGLEGLVLAPSRPARSCSSAGGRGARSTVRGAGPRDTRVAGSRAERGRSGPTRVRCGSGCCRSSSGTPRPAVHSPAGTRRDRCRSRPAVPPRLPGAPLPCRSERSGPLIFRL